MNYQQAKAKQQTLSLGDVIKHRNEDTEPVVISGINNRVGIIRVINVYTKQPLTIGALDAIKYYDIIYDNNGEMNVHQALNWAANKYGLKPILNGDDIKKMVYDALTHHASELVKEQIVIQENDIKELAEIKNKKYLTDGLKIGDYMKSHQIKDPAYMLVTYIDNLTNYVAIKNISTNKDFIKPFDYVNKTYARVAPPPIPPKKLNILVVKQMEYRETFVPNYNDTWRDRRYIKYCEKKGRDTKSWTNTEKQPIEVDYTQLLDWLRKSLTEDETSKLVNDLKQTKWQEQQEEIPVPKTLGSIS